MNWHIPLKYITIPTLKYTIFAVAAAVILSKARPIPFLPVTL